MSYFMQINLTIVIITMSVVLLIRAWHMMKIKRDPLRALIPFYSEPKRILINNETGEIKPDKAWVEVMKQEHDAKEALMKQG